MRKIDMSLRGKHLLNFPKRRLISRRITRQDERQRKENEKFKGSHISLLMDNAGGSQQLRITPNKSRLFPHNQGLSATTENVINRILCDSVGPSEKAYSL